MPWSETWGAMVEPVGHGRALRKAGRGKAGFGVGLESTVPFGESILQSANQVPWDLTEGTPVIASSSG